MSAYPQVLIDADGTTADEKIAPLANLVRQHGLVYQHFNQGNPSPEGFDQAWVTFTNPEQALEFLLHTANNMDFALDSQAILTIHPPLNAADFASAKVSWHPGFTDHMIRAWTRGSR